MPFRQRPPFNSTNPAACSQLRLLLSPLCVHVAELCLVSVKPSPVSRCRPCEAATAAASVLLLRPESDFTGVMPSLNFVPCRIMNWLPGLLLLLLVAEMAIGAAPCESPTAEPHHLIWEGVKLEVSNRRPSHDEAGGTSRLKRTTILDGINGHALPGRLLAIMGPSGCGKSSLLNVLAGRVPAAKQITLEGVVEVGETPLDHFDTQRYVAYVRQEHDFYPFLTVRETLLIKAGLRLDRSISHAQKELLVSEVMEKLGLSRSADTLVGDLRTPGISGGEKRRLAMGLQMIGLESPSILLLDEPTSGLDSHQALQVMATVRDLCSDGHTVLVAIHQPRSSIYTLFDDLLLLNDGRVVYHGSTKDVLPHLASLGHKCPNNFNPADFMVDLISPAVGDTHRNGEGWGSTHADANREEKEEILDRLAMAARESWKAKSPLLSETSRRDGKSRWWSAGKAEESFAVVPSASSVLTVSESRMTQGARRRRKNRGSGWPTQFGLLFRRSWKQATRDKFAAIARVALGFGLGGVFGSIFWKLNLSEGCISTRVSLFVNVAMNVAMFGCVRALQTLAVESAVVNLERMDEGYSASAYLSSKILAEMPTDAVFPLIFGTTVYFMAGLNTPLGGGLKLARFLGTLLVQAHASSAVGLMVGCLSPSMEAANLIGPSVVVVSLLLSGVHDNIPPLLAKLKVLSTVNWGVQGIVTNEMREIKFVPEGKVLLHRWKLGTNQQVIPGEDVMRKMGFEREGLRRPLTRLAQLSLGCHLITLVNLVAGIPKFQRLETASASSTSSTSSSPSAPPHHPPSSSPARHASPRRHTIGDQDQND